MKKKIVIFLIIFSILFSSASFCLAIETERGLEVTYPPSPAGTEPPRTTKTYLPQYILYIVEFFIVFGALAALTALVFGGFRYLTSAGSPGAMTDAKDQIFAGILGLVLLVSSFLILRTINPQLTSFKITAEPKFEGIVLYRGITDCGEKERVRKEAETERDWEWKEVLHHLEAQGKAARYKVSTSDLREISGNTMREVLSIRFPLEFYNQKTGDLKARAVIYPELSWEGKPPSLDSDNLNLGNLFGGKKQGCLSFSKKAGSLLFTWKNPGVYLCSARLVGENLICPTPEAEERPYTLPRPQYPDLAGFKWKTKGIKFKNIEGSPYGAILHSQRNFLGDMTVCLGGAEVLNYSDNSLPVTIRNADTNYGPEKANCIGWVEKKGVASLTLFQWDNAWQTKTTPTDPRPQDNGVYYREELYQDAVVLYEKTEFQGQSRVFQIKYDGGKYKDGEYGGEKIYGEYFKFFGKKLPILIYGNFGKLYFNIDEDGNIVKTKDTTIKQNIRSLKIYGNYLVILCRGYDLTRKIFVPTGTCEVFFSDHADLSNEMIGRCMNWPYWRLSPCAASMIIIPILPLGE